MALLTNTVKGSSRFGKKYRVVRQGGTTVHVYSDGTKIRMPTTTRQRPADGNSGQKSTPKKPTLTPYQQRVRANDRNPLYNPLQTLKGNSLIGAARKLTNLETQPAIDAAKRALRDTNIQGKALAGRAQGYYTQLGQREGGDAAKQAAISAALDERLKAIHADASAEIGQQQAAERTRETADHELRDTPAGANAQVDDELAALAARTAAAGARSRTQGAEQSANYEGLTGAMAGARQLRGGEVQGELLNRLASAQAEGRGKLADLRSQRGNVLTKNVLSMRDKAYENILGAKALDIKQQDILTGLQIAKSNNATRRANAKRAARVSAANNRRTTETSRANNAATTQTSAANNAATNATSRQNTKDRIKAAKARERAGGKPTASDRSFYGNVRIGTTKAGAHRDRGLTRQAAANKMLRGNPNMDPLIIGAALDMAYDGHVSRRHIAEMRAAGIRVPPDWLRATQSANRLTNRPG